MYPLPNVVFRFFDYADCPDDVNFFISTNPQPLFFIFINPELLLLLIQHYSLIHILLKRLFFINISSITFCISKGPLLPGAHSIERFLVEEELRWILDQEKANRKKW